MKKENLKKALAGSALLAGLLAGFQGLAQCPGTNPPPANPAGLPAEMVANGNFEQNLHNNNGYIPAQTIETGPCSPVNVLNWGAYSVKSTGGQQAPFYLLRNGNNPDNLVPAPVNVPPPPPNPQAFPYGLETHDYPNPKNNAFVKLNSVSHHGIIESQGVSTQLVTPAIAGKAYRARVWVYFDGAGADIPIYFYLHNNYLKTSANHRRALAGIGAYRDTQGGTVTPTYGWEQVEVYFKCEPDPAAGPAGSFTHLAVECHPYPGGDFYIDDISLEESCVGAPTVLGKYGEVTVIDAANYPRNTVAFSGDYLVRGPLEFINGTFTLDAGARFSFEPDGGVDPRDMGIMGFGSYYKNGQGPGYYTAVPYGYFPSILKISNATLILNGATLTSVCGGGRWGGISLTDTASIFTAESGGRRSQIINACIGIASAQRNPSGLHVDQTNTNYYEIRHTDFINNEIGLLDLGKDFPAALGEGVQFCTFSNAYTGIELSSLSGSRPPADGGIYGGWYDLAVFSGNKFTDTHIGISATVNRVHITGNEFSANTIGIFLWSYTGAHTVESNVITVADPVYLGGGIGHFGLEPVFIKNNTITGTMPPTGTPGYTGIEGWRLQASGNTITNLNNGIHYHTDNGDFSITNNKLTDNLNGVVLGPSQYYTGPFDVRCNGISAPGLGGSLTRGIYIEPGSDLTRLGGPGPAYPNNPNGNKFDASVDEPVCNDGNRPEFEYHLYATPSTEGVSSKIHGLTGGSRMISSISPVNACGAKSPGVNARLGGNTLAGVKEMVDSLALNRGGFAYSKRLQQEIMAWHEKTGAVAGLASYLARLRNRNLEAHNTFGLRLMAHYRKAGQEADAQFVKHLLLSANPGSAEITNRARFFDLADRWHDGRRMGPADSAALEAIAASGTSLSEAVCRLLYYIYPGHGCTAYRKSGARLTGHGKPAPKTGLGQLYPNPAQTEAALRYTLPVGCISAGLVITDLALGRALKTISLPAAVGEGEMKVDLRTFKTGLYNCTLLIDGKPAGHRKLSVIK